MPTIISPDHYRYAVGNGTYTFRPSAEPLIWGQSYRDFMKLCPGQAVILLMGLPGSGKTTWAQKNGTYELFFDATNLTVTERRPLIALATASSAASIEVVFIDTPLGMCLERNAKRSEDRRVPDEIVERMQKKLEAPDIDKETLSRYRRVTPEGTKENHTRGHVLDFGKSHD